MSCFILWFAREKGAALVSKLGKNAEFVEVNIESTNMLEKTLEGEFKSLFLSVLFCPLTPIAFFRMKHTLYYMNYVFICIHLRAILVCSMYICKYLHSQME